MNPYILNLYDKVIFRNTEGNIEEGIVIKKGQQWFTYMNNKLQRNATVDQLISVNDIPVTS